MANTIGERLKQAREAKGLSLEQASRAIHVRPHYLEALEKDERSALPSNVQGRGFLRLYADLLNLPIETLLAAWDGISQFPDVDDEIVTEVDSEFHSGTVDEITLVNTDSPVAVETSLPTGPDEFDVSSPEQGSQAIFREIGVSLRAQRELLGLTLAEVERFTRLRQHYIQAMEEGRMDGLPSPVQGKGMLSNYAAFLNLDEDALLLRFAEGLQTRRIERLPKAESQNLFTTRKKPARQAPFWRRFLTPDLIFGIGLAAITLLFVLWTVARIDTQNQTQAEPTTPAISEILLTPEELRLAPAVTSSPTTEVLPGEAQTGEMGSGESPESPATPESAISEAGSAQGQLPSSDIGDEMPGVSDELSTPTATLLPINNAPLQLYIIAHARAWLQVLADGKVVFLGRVVPGNAYAFSGEKQVEILTGNGAALQVIYNQNDLGRLGLTGEVIGLIFSSDGILTPTPAFTPTPTQAPPATITPLPSTTPQSTPTVTPFIP